jgi:SAM-dependent methyltransferase
LVRSIGDELGKPIKVNASLVTQKVRDVTMLSHKFMQFLPRVAAARDLFVKANGPLTPAQAHDWSQMSTRVYQARTWITDWPKIEKLVRVQVPAIRQKLYRRPTHTEAVTTSQLSVNDRIFNDLHLLLGQHSQDEKSRDHGCFADISLPQSVFIEHVHAAHRVLLAKRLRHPARFLDVGCGGGLKVLSAAKYFARADGLEYDSGYAASAQNLFDISHNDTCRVIEADGLTYENYDQYDVIYFYRPMRHIELLRQLEEQIVQTAQPGTLIIAPYKMFDYRYEELGCARIADRLYITQTSQSDADALRRVAEMTGVCVTVPVQNAVSVWDPILKASMAKGFSFDGVGEGFSTVH